MTSLLYKIKAGVGQCEKICGGDPTTVRIQIDGVTAGAVSVGNVSARIKDGVARLALLSLPDGEYTPLLHVLGKATPLERIRKSSGMISLAENDPNLRQQLRERLDSLEGTTDELVRRIEELESMVRPHTLFK